MRRAWLPHTFYWFFMITLFRWFRGLILWCLTGIKFLDATFFYYFTSASFNLEFEMKKKPKKSFRKVTILQLQSYSFEQ